MRPKFFRNNSVRTPGSLLYYDTGHFRHNKNLSSYQTDSRLL